MSAPKSRASHTGGAPGIDRSALPARGGIALKPEYFREVVESLPDIGFFEVHAENYMVDGGPFHHYLERVREHYPLSIHGVGLSIGSETALDLGHLAGLRTLIDRYEPQSFSEHLAWSSHGDVFLNDLFPVPYDSYTLQRVCDHIDQVQAYLKRPMLLENPATYVEFAKSTMEEGEFITEIIRRTGCGLLLDVNNVYVSCINHHREPYSVLSALPCTAVGQIHLAGFTQERDGAGDALLIDSHDAPVAQAVWDLYRFAIEQTGVVATLIERDSELPPLHVLAAEACRAESILHSVIQPTSAQQVHS